MIRYLLVNVKAPNFYTLTLKMEVEQDVEKEKDHGQR